ncbi:MAG: hypothetical protein RI933_1227 [Actinomycetota bacterium]|jgi:UDP-perosamine 4-acetyltransferase
MADLKLVMLGSGGHARVLQSILSEVGFDLHGYVAPRDVDSILGLRTDGSDVPWLGYDANLMEFSTEEFLLVNGLGSTSSLRGRASVFAKFKAAGFNFLQVEAPSAFVADSASMLEGVQVLNGAIIGPDVFIDDNTIVNTGAIIEHGSNIEKSVHVSVGARICGDVSIGANTHIGAGATVIQGISIGENCIIGAGAVVIRDIPDNHIAIGVPAQASPIEEQ